MAERAHNVRCARAAVSFDDYLHWSRHPDVLPDAVGSVCELCQPAWLSALLLRDERSWFKTPEGHACYRNNIEESGLRGGKRLAARQELIIFR